MSHFVKFQDFDPRTLLFTSNVWNTLLKFKVCVMLLPCTRCLFIACPTYNKYNFKNKIKPHQPSLLDYIYHLFIEKFINKAISPTCIHLLQFWNLVYAITCYWVQMPSSKKLVYNKNKYCNIDIWKSNDVHDSSLYHIFITTLWHWNLQILVIYKMFSFTNLAINIQDVLS
jgi:hypothetical protein